MIFELQNIRYKALIFSLLVSINCFPQVVLTTSSRIDSINKVIEAKFHQLVEIQKEIDKMESELSNLKSQYEDVNYTETKFKDSKKYYKGNYGGCYYFDKRGKKVYVTQPASILKHPGGFMQSPAISTSLLVKLVPYKGIYKKQGFIPPLPRESIRVVLSPPYGS